MDNIIDCRLDSTCKEIYTGIWQHDYGQILRITGVNLPKAVEVQFSLRDKGGDTLTRIGTTVDGVTEVKVPDSFLKNENCTQNYLIYAWIYITDNTSGNTEYQIILHVKSRPKPEEPTEEPLPEPNIFHKTVKAVNDAADRAEQAEQNAKASATEAGKYAASASESAATAEKTKEDALKEVGEKKQEAIEAIQDQEETSVRKIVNHTDNEIKWIQNQTAESKGELEQTITNAGVSKEELEHSIETAGTSKTALDKSTELAGTAKTEMDTSTQKAGEAKTALDGSTNTAGEMQETLSATVKQAGALDTSLSEKIEVGTQLNEDITASGEKAVQDIQAAGSEQLGKMQTVAEEFTADREQITTNKEDISSLKEELSKNYLDDAKTKRSLDALWKLNQGISYQFETDTERAYQKDIPSGAKLASVKKIGGRTIVWNQLVSDGNFQLVRKWSTQRVNPIADNGELTCTVTVAGKGSNAFAYDGNTKTVVGHKYYITTNWYIASTNASSGFICGLRGALPESPIPGNPDAWNKYSTIGTVTNSSSIFIATLGGDTEVGDIFKIKNVMVTDLTKMFGTGNEPSTPEEFEALFPEDYYPYNDGTLMSIPVNEVRNRGYSNIDISEFARAYPDKCNFSDGVLHILSADTDLFSQGIPVTAKTGDKLTVDIKCGTATNARLRARLKTGVEVDITSGVNATEWNHSECVLSVDVVALMLNWSTAGTFSIRNLCVNGKPYYCEEYPIPQAILNLDGYGDGVSDDVYNYVDLENKEYHKRVGKYTIDGSEKIVKEKSYWVMTVTDFEKPRPLTLNAICTNFKISKSFYNKFGNIIFRLSSNGFVFTDSESKFANANEVKDYFQQNNETIYYELDEEQIIDISDIIDTTFQEPIEVEAGGTLKFQNSNGDSYRLPIPNEEEYIVSLAEVGGGASE